MHPQETLKHSQVDLSQSLMGITVPFPGPWLHKVLLVPSKHLWSLLNLILNAVVPHLLSCCGFSFTLGLGVSVLAGFQHSPIDGCSAAHGDFGVFIREDVGKSFSSMIFVVWEI